MNRLYWLVLAVAFMLIFASCSSETEATPHTENAYSDLYPQSMYDDVSDDGNDPLMLSYAIECDYNRFYEFKVDETASYKFEIIKTSSKANDNLKWFVYVLDEPFDNGLRYLYESNNPDCTIVLDEAVTLNLVEDDFIYCFCSYNEYNATSDIDAGAYLRIERQ